MKLSPWRRPSSITNASPCPAAITGHRSRPTDAFDTIGQCDGADAKWSHHARRRVQKRVFDILVIWSLSPFILASLSGVAVAVALKRDGSILYVQDRVGLDGRVFRMWKFRTMSTDRPGEEVTRVQDDRVTPLGRFLRQSHLDELPQIWNVLRGEMSLVGPRPEQPALARRYSLDSPEFELRQRVLPGITGWAQVSCSYASNLSETMIKLSHDLYYIEHQNMAFDVWILLRTFAVVAGRNGR